MPYSRPATRLRDGRIVRKQPHVTLALGLVGRIETGRLIVFVRSFEGRVDKLRLLVSPDVALFAAKGRPKMDAKFHAGKRQLVARKQRTARDTLAVHLGSVRATQIADKKQTVGLGDEALELGDTGLLEQNVA